MKGKINIFIFLMTFLFFSCEKNKVDNITLESSWEEIQKEAKGETVNFYAWGGSESINNFLDTFVSDELKKQGINFKRIPVTDIKIIINRLLSEKLSDKKTGSVDLMWINGENFKIAKDRELLWGEFSKNLPNLKKYVDEKTIKYDFGEPIKYFESPWGTAQFVFVIDSSEVNFSPKNIFELTEILKNNPGKFTYPQSSDFVGSAFLRQILNQINPKGYKKILEKTLSNEEVKKELLPLWKYLNSIKPYIWRKGETYPENSGKLHELYGRGEICITMDYTPLLAESKIKNGSFPKTSKTFVFEKGSLFNNHYVSIPYNAKNKAAAMILANILLSPKAQSMKLDPKNWGDGTVLNIEKLSKEDKEMFDDIKLSKASLSFEELGKKRIPELPSRYIDIIEREWVKNVAQKN